MERLAERNIPAFIVHGNHDPLNGWGSGFRLPSNVTVFGGHPDTETYVRRGRAVAEIAGVSSIHVRGSLTTWRHRSNVPSIRHIQLLYCTQTLVTKVVMPITHRLR